MNAVKKFPLLIGIECYMDKGQSTECLVTVSDQTTNHVFAKVRNWKNEEWEVMTSRLTPVDPIED